jgi:hypothetical protein
MTIAQQEVALEPRKSRALELGNLIVSVLACDSDAAVVVIGSPGLPNIKRRVELGDAVLIETPADGMLEVRAMNLSKYGVEMLVSRVSPRLGYGAEISTSEAENSHLQPDEVEKVRQATLLVLDSLAGREDVSPEQLDVLKRSLADLADASTRLGRKDWIMFAAGTLTNICVGAAFAPEATKALFQLANRHLGWLFQNALRLL